jgi:hypothetical protein
MSAITRSADVRSPLSALTYPETDRETEVEQLRAAGGEHDVGGLHVAMDHAVTMSLIEGIGDLDGVPKGFLQGQRVVATPAQPRGQCFALEIFHHEVVGAVVPADVVNGTDVRVIEAGNRPGFAAEPLAPRGVACRLGGNHFDGDGAVQAAVNRPIHLSHSAHGDPIANFVRADRAPLAKGHSLIRSYYRCSQRSAACPCRKLYRGIVWAGAARELKRGIDLAPNAATFWYGTYLAAMGRTDEAIAEAKRAQALDPLSPVMVAGVSWMSHLAHRHDETIEFASRALELDPSFAAWLERAYDEHAWGLAHITVDPPLDPLRADPRFQKILQRMNFPK